MLEGKRPSSTEKFEDDVIDTKNNLKPPKGDRPHAFYCMQKDHQHALSERW
jgi:hypothetical protein